MQTDNNNTEKKITTETWKLDGLVIKAFGRGIICEVPTVSKGGVMECVANAQLIASAPTLQSENEKLNKMYKEQVKINHEVSISNGNLIAKNFTLKERNDTLVEALKNIVDHKGDAEQGLHTYINELRVIAKAAIEANS